MTLTRFCLLALGLILLGEAGLAVWRYAPVRPSTEPVFRYPEGIANFGKGEDMTAAIKSYLADRGSGFVLRPGDGLRLDVYYLEWDQYQVAPLMKIGVHNPEVCNVAHGLKLEEIGQPRIHQRGSSPPLAFDYTRFTDRGGRPLFVFKTVFIQGLGSLNTRNEETWRFERLQKSFTRHIGQARVLQGFVTGTADADQAWQAFERTVLDHLEWQ